jgi:hypothetical protein
MAPGMVYTRHAIGPIAFPWDRVVSKGLLDQISKGGEVDSVMIGVHRADVLL